MIYILGCHSGLGMNRKIKADGLPYKTRVYINNQVLIPSDLVKSLGIEKCYLLM